MVRARSLRVSVAVFCLLNLVLFAWLWLRSFAYSEEIWFRAPIGKPVGIWSGVGRLALTLHTRTVGEFGVHYMGPWEQSDRWRRTQQRTDIATPTRFGFSAGTMPSGDFRLMVPHWFPMLLIAGLAAGSWIVLGRFRRT